MNYGFQICAALLRLISPRLIRNAFSFDLSSSHVGRAGHSDVLVQATFSAHDIVVVITLFYGTAHGLPEPGRHSPNLGGRYMCRIPIISQPAFDIISQPGDTYPVPSMYRKPPVSFRAPRSKSGCGHPDGICLLYTSPSPRDQRGSRMPSSA